MTLARICNVILFGLIPVSGVALAQWSTTAAPPQWSTSTGIAGYRSPLPIAVSPGQVITLFVEGLTASDVSATSFPLPTSLAGITVRADDGLAGYSANLPIFSVKRDHRGGILVDLTAINIQIPTEINLSDPDVPIGSRSNLLITVSENGVKKDQAQFRLVQMTAHILDTCDTVTRTGGACLSTVTHGDGRLVTPQDPAAAGEEVTMWAVGLGQTTPIVPAGTAPASPTQVEQPNRFSIQFEFFECNGCSNPPVSLPESKPRFAGLTPGFVGLYQVNVKLPDQIPASRFPCEGTSDGANLAIRIGWDMLGGTPTVFSDPARICVRTGL